MARLHLEILGISEQKWMGMGEFNSDYHYIWVAPIVKKRVWNAILWYKFKNDRMTSLCFQGKSFNIIVVQVYAPSTDAKEVEVA